MRLQHQNLKDTKMEDGFLCLSIRGINSSSLSLLKDCSSSILFFYQKLLLNTKGTLYRDFSRLARSSMLYPFSMHSKSSLSGHFIPENFFLPIFSFPLSFLLIFSLPPSWLVNHYNFFLLLSNDFLTKSLLSLSLFESQCLYLF